MMNRSEKRNAYGVIRPEYLRKLFVYIYTIYQFIMIVILYLVCRRGSPSDVN